MQGTVCGDQQGLLQHDCFVRVCHQLDCSTDCAERGCGYEGAETCMLLCRPSFSPDGRYVLSGDGSGRLLFWEWRDTKIVRTFKAHDAVCIDAAWHPLESSKVATASWDGAIKYWD